ncbi:uncharacterized protein LOC113510256 [Galleria mellonella]|uniref:Uncharacterized protein LOC113510256 n=1 Tax=Galleria mellonella TaxID=7137 RepID=A0A6J1WFU7_GALME|nr:uncharacterized protein LOC113510256 [Galleria mellonella]
MSMVEELIDEVEKRPMLWNRRHLAHSNRAKVDREWGVVAKILRSDKYKVKNKWRNLRDQFLREAKKLAVPSSGTNDQPLISFYKGKWMYFERLLFMKETVDDQIKKRRNSATEDAEEELDFSKQVKLEEISITEHSLPSEFYNDYMNSYQQIYKTQISEMKLEPEEPEEVTVCPTIKRENDLSEKITVSDDDRIKNEVEIDDDMHFVKSLVPFLRNLTPVRKLMIRNEIQSLLMRELINENQKTCSCNKT